MTFDSPELCIDKHRRNEIRARGRNGIDYVEVSDDQRSLTLHLLRRAPEDLQRSNVVIEGGIRIRGIKVLELIFCSAEDPEEDDCLRVVVDRAGDFSDYEIKLIEIDAAGDPTNTPFHEFDPRYSHLKFSFKAGLPSDLDCETTTPCDPPILPQIQINYLARDFASFRQLILDRLALIMPNWQEQHTADEGIALVEILAYTADYLSYYQDAVATEAYLGTARKRISVRRHVRLLDYPMHEGCNARAWVQIQASEDHTIPAATPPPVAAPVLFLAGFPSGTQTGTILSLSDLTKIQNAQYEIFEPLLPDALALHAGHNRIPFYTWNDHQCVLPKGTTSATLLDAWADEARESAQTMRSRTLQLCVGEYLLLEETIGPLTGVPEDADTMHRWMVRLTSVEATIDSLNAQPIVEIAWDLKDALPFALCLSSLGPAPHCELLKHVSVARGNITLVDQGSWVTDEALGTVPLQATTQTCLGQARVTDITLEAGQFYPALQVPNLTYRAPFPANAPASQAFTQDPTSALPQIHLQSIAGVLEGTGPVFSLTELRKPTLLAMRLSEKDLDDASLYLYEQLPRSVTTELANFNPSANNSTLLKALAQKMATYVRDWTPRIDLLNSDSESRDFVVEMDDNRIAHLRFGDSLLGANPEPGETFFANYRVAGETVANVGAGTINQIVLSAGTVVGLTLAPDNPVAAAGAIDPEPIGEVKMVAPGNFLKQLDRAITADDYATLAERNPMVQRAAASLQRIGSRYDVQVAIDPLGGDDKVPDLLRAVEHYLYPFRRIGHDLRVVQATYVPLDLTLNIQVASNYLQAHVKRALMDAFSNRKLGANKTGFFHPDNLTFGQNIYASAILSVAQSLDGVDSVQIENLGRLFDDQYQELVDGVLSIGPLEVAQLDNDAAYPERGRLRVHARGGR